MDNFIKRRVLLAALFAIMLGCNNWSLKSDRQATEAVLGLKKLEAKIDSGIAYHDYSVAVGDSNFLVRQFLEDDKAKSVSEFSSSLRNAMKWYKAAEEIWRRQVEAPVVLGYCAAGRADFQVTELCDAYPELVTIVPGKIPSEKNTSQFSINMLNLTILVQGSIYTPGKEIDGSAGVIYDLATQESWRRAAFEVDNAKRSLAGDRPEKSNAKALKTDRRAEMNYLIIQAKKSL